MKRLILSLLVGLGVASTSYSELQEAKVTRVYREVDLLQADRAPEPAEVGDSLAGEGAVQTGNQSRAELRFNDATVARLGANSIFTFEKGTRNMDLKDGVILLQVPKNAGGAKINTAAVSAAITGTTVLIQAIDVDEIPDNSDAEQTKIEAGEALKFIVVEGSMRLRKRGFMGDFVDLTAGQIMVVQPGMKKFPQPEVVDLQRLVETSGLLGPEFEPLQNEPEINQAIQTQQALKSQGKLINLNYGLYGDKKLPVVQQGVNNTQTGLRTDAESRPSAPQQPRSNQVKQPRSDTPPPPPPKVDPKPKPPKPKPPTPKPPKPPDPKPPKPPEPKPPKPPKPVRPPLPPPPNKPAPPVLPQPPAVPPEPGV